jgi:hypothetical protein
MRSFLTFASLVALALALPQFEPEPTPPPGSLVPFKLVARNSYTPIDTKYFNAALSNLYINLPRNNALCARGENPDLAFFYLIGDGLYTWTTRNPIQQFWVDRSVTGGHIYSSLLYHSLLTCFQGQGKVGYLTQDHWIPPAAEFSGWAIDANGDLTFNGAGFIACPGSLDGPWSVWVDSGVAQPGGNQGCVAVSGRQQVDRLGLSCTYTVNGTLWEIERPIAK